MSFADERGVVSWSLPLLLWLATVVAVVVVDIGAYLVAASRAQGLADSAALAAVATAVPGVVDPEPQREAARVAGTGGGRVESCACPPGAEVASVAVSVPVTGLVVPNLGAGRITAEARAMLAPPEELPAGPTRERSRWPRPPP